MARQRLRYSDITFGDPSAIKRYVQRRRLADALSVLGRPDKRFAGRLLDYGAGNGELTKLIAKRFPEAQVVCYEPSLEMLAEAQENLFGLENVDIVSSLKVTANASFDYVFCLEVFEHLPPGQTAKVIRRIDRLLGPHGMCVVGVPNELYIMALLKGAFRMQRALRSKWHFGTYSKRHFGTYDTSYGNILRAAVGKPPTDRPRKRLGPGLPYHPHHTGFDHRRLRAQLCETFEMVRAFGSPLGKTGELLNSEIIFVMKKRH